MSFTFTWPPPKDSAWSPEAALTLVGQKVLVNGTPGKVVACEITDLGLLTVDVEMEENEDENQGHPV